MASLSDLYNTYGANPQAWAAYPSTLQGDDIRTNAGLQNFRTLRDFSQYNLPDLVSSFAARGTSNSGRADRDINRLATSTQENVGDVTRSAGTSLNDLSTKAVGANIGASF